MSIVYSLGIHKSSACADCGIFTFSSDNNKQENRLACIVFVFLRFFTSCRFGILGRCVSLHFPARKIPGNRSVYSFRGKHVLAEYIYYFGDCFGGRIFADGKTQKKEAKKGALIIPNIQKVCTDKAGAT